MYVQYNLSVMTDAAPKCFHMGHFPVCTEYLYCTCTCAVASPKPFYGGFYGVHTIHISPILLLTF